jgi:biopolymer transport protein ExbB
MSFNLMHIWASMGLMSKIIAGCLLLMAAMCLAVVIERWIALLRGDAVTRTFMSSASAALDEGQLERIVQLADEHKQSPFARMTGQVIKKFIKADDGALSRLELAKRETERQQEAIQAELRRGLGVLASVGSVAPFVGLLGTVVGIISAFQGIAATGSGGLGSVSAGISEALVETALGLCVAIPATLLFNNLTAKITTVESSVARASGELLDELENNHVRARKPSYVRAA